MTCRMSLDHRSIRRLSDQTMGSLISFHFPQGGSIAHSTKGSRKSCHIEYNQTVMGLKLCQQEAWRAPRRAASGMGPRGIPKKRAAVGGTAASDGDRREGGHPGGREGQQV